MDAPHSNIRLDNFRHMFPTCNKCQDGNVTSEQLLVHLTATHFRNEALKSFGNGITCLMCKKSLAPHKEIHRQYHVLSHMVLHFDQFAPKESKTDIGKTMIKDKGRNYLEEISEPVYALDKEQLSPDVDMISYSVFKNKSKSKHDMKDASNTAQGSEEKLKSASEIINVRTTEDQLIAKQACKRAPLGQDLQDYFKNMYPHCKKCRKQYEGLWKLKRHVAFVHFKAIAIQHFGEGDTCSICKKFAVKPDMARIGQIKTHMALHLDKLIQDNMTGNTSLNGHLDSTIAHNKRKAPLITKSESLDANCRSSITASKNHETKETTNLRDRSNKQDNLPVIWFSDNQNNKYQLVSNLTCKKVFQKQDIQDYFRKIYSSCKKCQKGHRDVWRMKRHISFIHYGSRALTLFGDGDACGICKNFLLKPCVSNGMRASQIKTHMALHFEELIHDKIPYPFLLPSQRLKDCLAFTIPPKKEAQPLSARSESLHCTNTQNSIKVSKKYESKETSTCIQDRTKKQDNLPATWNSDKINQEGLLLAKQNFKKGLQKQYCQDYFRKMYPSCKKCQKGHRDAWKMKRHISFIHYGNRAIRLFGNGDVCELCRTFLLKPYVSNGARASQIKTHMVWHFELLFPD